MSPLETFRAVTSHAARALDEDETLGQIRVGGPADFVVFEARELVDIPYHMGRNLVREVYINGKVARSRKAT